MAYIKSVLIIGGSGFLGTAFALKLRDRFKVFATYYKRPISIPGVTMLPFDINERNWVKRTIYMAQPDVVIYAAGYNSIESTHTHRNSLAPLAGAPTDNEIQSAERIHAEAPATLANLTEILQPKFIYLSNPYVFDGTKGNYHESDTLVPSSVLGKMKSSGENIVRSKCMNYIILRSSPVFGRGSGINVSFLDRLRMSLERNQRFEASHKELHSFAPVEGLADVIYTIVDSGLRNKILHYGGLTRATFYDLAIGFAKRFGYDPSLIIPIDKPLSPMPPHYEGSFLDFSLNSSQSIQTLKIKPFFLEEGLDLIKKKLIS